MYTPASNDEITGYIRYIDQQLAAIRAAAVGLTEEEARTQPCRSVLSIGGLLKHATYCMRGAVERLGSPAPAEQPIDEAAYGRYVGSFALAADEPAAAALADFDTARVEYLDALAGLEPDAATVEPPSPWYGIFDARPANGRYYLVHQIEELARHAGHADIIREQLDGMAVPAIVLSEEGAPANDFFQPYVPAPGALGAR